MDRNGEISKWKCFISDINILKSIKWRQEQTGVNTIWNLQTCSNGEETIEMCCGTLKSSIEITGSDVNFSPVKIWVEEIQVYYVVSSELLT